MQAGSRQLRGKLKAKAQQRAPVSLAGLATALLMLAVLLLGPHPPVGAGGRPGIAPIGAARQAAPSHESDIASTRWATHPRVR
jgi:hypothetical protein